MDAEELVGGDAEDEGETDDDVGVGAELVELVVGNDGLDGADLFGELHLGEAALFAQAVEALPEGLSVGRKS